MNDREKELKEEIKTERKKVDELRKHANSVLAHGADVLRQVSAVDTVIPDEGKESENSVAAPLETPSGFSLNSIIVTTLAGTELLFASIAGKYYLESRSVDQTKYT
eukprot:UN01402